MMQDNQRPPESFWIDNVSKSLGKHNIAPQAWEKICKMRSSPIKLVKDFIIGEPHKPHMVIPEGYKGYLIDYPEAFNLSEKDLQDITENTQNWFSDRKFEGIPACFFGVNHLVFLSDDDYEIISPYFDMGIANYGGENILTDK